MTDRDEQAMNMVHDLKMVIERWENDEMSSYNLLLEVSRVEKEYGLGDA